MKLVACSGRDALAIGNGYAGDPDDFFPVGNERQGVTLMSRNMGVDQNVLETLGLAEAERAHAVAGPAGSNHQRLADQVGVEVTHLSIGPEGCRIAAAGFDRQPPRRKGRGGGGRRLAASKRFSLEEAGVGNEPSDDPPLQGRRQPGKRGAVAGDGVRQAGNLSVEKAVFFTEDVGGARQQLPGGRIEGVDRGEDLLPETIASEAWVVVAGVAQWGQMESRQIGLNLLSRDVEERPGKVAVASSHGTKPSRAAASEEMQKQGFDLIILGVTQGNGGAARFGSDLSQERIAGGAGGGFRMRRVVRRAGRAEVISPDGGHRRNEIAILRTVGAPAVVEMGDSEMQRDGGKDLTENREQGERVWSTRDRDDDALARLEDVVEADEGGDPAGEHHWYGGGKDRTCDIPGMGRLLYH